MPRICCLAASRKDIAILSSALRDAGEATPTIVGRLNVAELVKLAPNLLVVDLDRLEVDPLEMLRQIRFVLPDCVVAVYTEALHLSWSRACHLAGANCLLAKSSPESELSRGLRNATRGGCFTDPRFVA